MASIEIKVRKLDGELARYKEQMSKLRNGPGKVRLDSTSDSHLALTPRYTGRDPTTRSTYTKAKADVRSPNRAAHPTNVQHGERSARH